MRILLTGANGYIGKRLLPALLEAGHSIVALVRMGSLEIPESYKDRVLVVNSDLLELALENSFPDIDIAYYLVHSMSDTEGDFAIKEAAVAYAFNALVLTKKVRQVIYLSGLVNAPDLSDHLASRLHVERILASSGIPLTVFRAGIIIGSGSASFEIIRDLVELLPVMVAPRWLTNECQPISIHDVVYYLVQAIDNPKCFQQRFDIGGPEILTFKALLERLAVIRGLRRWIFTIPLLTPRLSAYWLFFVTATNFQLARRLVESMRNRAVCEEHSIQKVIPHECLDYNTAVQRAFSQIAENTVISSWQDAWEPNDTRSHNLKDYIQVPEHGCLHNTQSVSFPVERVEAVLANIWSIGGKRGWYGMDWAWNWRGFGDKLVGGVGRRRGRRHPYNLQAGDALDFWRVVLADREGRRLLLYAEMKLPGEAWLEFHIPPQVPGSDVLELRQTATFRPHGLLGRLYWYLLLPIHPFIFRSMARGIVNTKPE